LGKIAASTVPFTGEPTVKCALEFLHRLLVPELGQNMKRGIEAAFNVANTVAHPPQGLLAQLVS
jgi:hypothetical protein